MNEHPYWWDTQSAVDREQPAIDLGSTAYDVAIVGSGYTGLSAARYLAKIGATVVVLERERIGWGASSRNAGQVLTGLKVEPATLVRRYGETRARELFDLSLTSIDDLEAIIRTEEIDCEYERTGHIQAAAKPKHFHAFRAEQALLDRVFGHRVTLVPREHQPAELATERYHGLLIDERSGSLNPAKYVAGLAAAATRYGAAIVERTGVTGLRRAGGRWTIDTSGGRVDAGDVLVATNGYTGAATPLVQRRFVPVGSYMIATEPLPRALARALLPRRRMAFDSKHFLYYFRLTGDDRLLFGGRAEFGEPTPDSTRRAATILRRGLAEVFPQLATVPVEYAWSGRVAFTRDQMPHAGRLDGVYYAGGYCGHGIAMATSLGTIIARRMAGEPIEHPLVDDRVAAIPLYRGRPWFLPLVGAYYRLRDLID